jgi:excisionase family DNA binding protein
MPSPENVGFRRSSNAPVMQAGGEVVGGPLLTVKEAPEQLRVSVATVYGLCEAGKLAFTRVSTHSIRIAAGDLAEYVRSLRTPVATTRRAAPSR